MTSRSYLSVGLLCLLSHVRAQELDPPKGPTSEVLISEGRPLAVRGSQWKPVGSALTGTGGGNRLQARFVLGAGDFHVTARLRMREQKNSAAGFFYGPNFFGFEGASGTLFRNGPAVGGLKLMQKSPQVFEREAWIAFEVVREGTRIRFVIDGKVLDQVEFAGAIGPFGFDPMRSTMEIASWSVRGALEPIQEPYVTRRTKDCPWIDLSYDAGLVTTTTRGETARARERLDGKRPLPVALSGTQYLTAELPDGRALVTFLDKHPNSPTRGSIVAWVGTKADLREGREGAFTARLLRPDQLGDAIENRSLTVDERGVVTAIARGRHGDAVRLLSASFTLRDLAARVPTRGYHVPTIDIDQERERQVVVDRERGQYLGHPTTCLLEDGKTVLCVFPKGHGRGGIVYKRSTDGGHTWSERLPVPDNWSTSREVPTIHRTIDPRTGKKRLIMWSGLYPARLAVSEDDGNTWSPLEKVGDWGGIVVMGFVERLRDGRYVAMFHDDGRFFTASPKRQDPVVFTLYQTFSADGGLTWSFPEAIWSGSDVHLCEPGCIRSPDGSTLAVLLRENSRRRNAFVIFSRDEAKTWSAPRELPASLTGDRHTGKYGPDGRLFVSFRDLTHDSPTKGDWVGWVGTWDDLLQGREGQYRVRLKDNWKSADCAYPGVEILPDGTFLTTTYGHWTQGESPYVLSVRFTLDELDAHAARLPTQQVLFHPGDLNAHTFRIPALVKTTQGTLIAACDARNPSGRDLPNDIDTVVRRSTDGGVTWSAPVRVIDREAPEGTADPALLVDRTTGRIWLAVTWSRDVDWRSSRPGYGMDSFHDLMIWSDDDGLTWSEPVDVTESLKDPASRSAWFSPGHGFQSASSRLLFPYSVADAAGTMFTYAVVSDDHGGTWKRVGPIGERTNEAMITSLADGRLLCNLRSVHGKNRRALAFSSDEGNTWGGFTHDDALVEPVCQASVLRFSAKETARDQDVLLFSNPASTKRENLTLRASFDGGMTWPVERVLHAGPAAYSDMVLVDGDTLGVLYEAGDVSPYEGLVFARVPLSWILD
ncbi:MAG: exo-alpha-sialidase [Planctomycetes bacterium]|nr:exo-alpha-sialidase [Planctomycetota bacterium]MCB9890899.1 exo-alpha-sialidase [Planctomycetota bacterium]